MYVCVCVCVCVCVYISMIKHSGLYYRASIYTYCLALVNAFRLDIPYCINNVMRFVLNIKSGI